MIETTSQEQATPPAHAQSSERRPIIAIDGPAGSGKSTTARLLARRLGFTYLDTGAFYRALTLKILEAQIPPDHQAAVVREAQRTHIAIRSDPDGDRVYLDGRDVTTRIRDPHITNAIAPISGNPGVRELMVKRQREIGRKGGVVMEGRDIGTVVFPEADLKVFMNASLDERTRRRQRELEAKGLHKDFQTLRREIEIRDEKDSRRAVAPLRPAEDAILLDTTNLTLEQQVDFIIAALQHKLAVRAENGRR